MTPAEGQAAGSHDGPAPPIAAREILRAALDAGVARLVARAADERWPIRADHCFLRIAYDNAVGLRWDVVHARPGWRSLPPDVLTAAIDTLAAIEREGLTALRRHNARSLAFRRR